MKVISANYFELIIFENNFRNYFELITFFSIDLTKKFNLALNNYI